MVPPAAAWQRLFLLQEVLLDRPELAHALRRLPIAEQLLLTLELLTDPEELAHLPPNVVPFRPRSH